VDVDGSIDLNRAGVALTDDPIPSLTKVSPGSYSSLYSSLFLMPALDRNRSHRLLFPRTAQTENPIPSNDVVPELPLKPKVRLNPSF
jgi:hypothetical protein